MRHGEKAENREVWKRMIEKRIEDFENMAFGMFIHWGLYSLLGKGEWIMEQEQIPGAEYRKLQESFAGENFDAEKIARLAPSAVCRDPLYGIR